MTKHLRRTLQLQVNFKSSSFLLARFSVTDNRDLVANLLWLEDHLANRIEAFYDCVMSQLSISEVARQVGLRPSTIRYYEQVGVLPPAPRKSGQRRYDGAVLRRLAVIQRARDVGFTLDEIRELFFEFGHDTTPSKRWQEMSGRKLVELEVLADRIQLMKRLLTRLQSCSCTALDECGERLLQHRGIEVEVSASQR